MRECTANRVSLILILTLVSLPAFAADKPFDPDGFHECMLENVKGDMGKHAVIAVRQSCAHRNGTDTAGNKKAPTRKSFSMAGIPEDSIFAHARKAPEFRTLKNTEIVEYVRRQYHPDKTYQRVKDWLINTKLEDQELTQ